MRLPQSPPALSTLLGSSDFNVDVPSLMAAGVGSLVDGEYVHWDQIRRRPVPGPFSRETWWMGIKLARGQVMRPVPLRAVNGDTFHYSLPDRALELLHWIDQHGAGEIVVSETIKDPGDRRRYLVNSLFEEAITSSQLEGASATRQVAKDMLRSGRPPRDRGERMILNNYQAMSMLRPIAARPLTPADVLDLHRTLTEDTLDDATAAGRLQRPDEDRVVVQAPDGTVAHVPPPASDLPERLEAMCRFANGFDTDGFMHPVVRAVLLHLWLAYDHPFEDGNGRTARALFYREMLASGYWLFEYVTISRLLLRAPVQYGRAFLYTETDDFDATYFLLHQLEILRRAIDELHAYLRRKMAELRETLSLVRRIDLNYRQKALLTNALTHPDAVYTFQSHATSHRVVRQSARTDLISLEQRGLLTREKVGRTVVFRPDPDLKTKISTG